LTQGEVDTLRSDGILSARTGFPGGRDFQYVLESSPASVAPGALFSDNVITVHLPETTVLAWASSEQVSIEGVQILDDGEQLAILVEKDFSCLAPREGEDESDMYPHPNADNNEE
jgi:hypothetical protein